MTQLTEKILIVLFESNITKTHCSEKNYCSIALSLLPSYVLDSSLVHKVLDFFFSIYVWTTYENNQQTSVIFVVVRVGPSSLRPWLMSRPANPRIAG